MFDSFLQLSIVGCLISLISAVVNCLLLIPIVSYYQFNCLVHLSNVSITLLSVCRLLASAVRTVRMEVVLVVVLWCPSDHHKM